MAFEISVEVRLVGEVVLAHKFLETLVSVHERHLKLYNSVAVDEVFSILSRRTLTHGIKMAGRDIQLLGVELHRALLSEVSGDKVAEQQEGLLLVLESKVFLHLLGRGCSLCMLRIEQQCVCRQDDVLATVVAVGLHAVELVLDNLYLLKGVCDECLLVGCPSALVGAAGDGLYRFGAERASCSEPNILGNAQETCRKVAGDVVHGDVASRWTDDDASVREAETVAVYGDDSLATLAPKEGGELQRVCVLHELLQG